MILFLYLKHLILVFFFLAVSIVLQWNIKSVQIPPKYLRPPEAMKYFTFGYADFTASVLWIRVLQNFDYCEGGKYQESDYVPPIADAKNKLQGVLLRKMKEAKCEKGWVYSMLHIMTEILPRFKTAYEVGAPFLSIIVDDREGARLIFEKGIKLYPNDWQLSFAAGYHYLWEIQDPKRSVQLLKQSLDNGGPEVITSLIAGLYSEVGQAEYAYEILIDALKKDPPKEIRERLKLRLKEVEAVLKANKKELSPNSP
ncbi:hypothetical protein K2X05_00730 [bacterium]|nr:hypothetical protein [bacterium]